jgi:uncharacterized YigZ family protein
MTGSLIPASNYKVESWVKNSHFIATIGPAFTVSDARDFIAEINEQYADATHNVPAYVIGSGPSTIAHSSDDGEPSGTAGKPALSVLIGSELGDTVLVITRYFGGTKLGTGGLVKAYSNAAKDAVQGVPKANKISVHQASITCPYNIHESALRLVKLHRGLNIQEKFSEHVQIDFSLPKDELSALQESISELSNGQIPVIILKKNLIALQPIRPFQEKSTHA